MCHCGPPTRHKGPKMRNLELRPPPDRQSPQTARVPQKWAKETRDTKLPIADCALSQRFDSWKPVSLNKHRVSWNDLSRTFRSLRLPNHLLQKHSTQLCPHRSTRAATRCIHHPKKEPRLVPRPAWCGVVDVLPGPDSTRTMLLSLLLSAPAAPHIAQEKVFEKDPAVPNPQPPQPKERRTTTGSRLRGSKNADGHEEPMNS